MNDKTIILRCLFIQAENQITTVLYENKKYILIKFDGEISTPYDSSFWDRFKKYTAYIDGQNNDFCFLSDSEIWELPQWILNHRVTPTVWSVEKIQQALSNISYRNNLYLRDNNFCIFRCDFPENKYFLTFHHSLFTVQNSVKHSENTAYPPLEAYCRAELKKIKERNKM